MKFRITNLLMLLSSVAMAQGFKTSVVCSPGASNYLDGVYNLQKSKPGFCFSAAVREEFYLKKTLSIGTELGLNYTSGTFYSRDHSVFGIPEVFHDLRHTVSMYSVSVPIIINLRTKPEINKGMFFSAGAGISCLLYSYRKVDKSSSWLGQGEDRKPFMKEQVHIKSEKGDPFAFYGVVGLGKNFSIKDKTFFCEIKYSFDATKWLYPTVNDSEKTTYDLQRRSVVLGLGMML